MKNVVSKAELDCLRLDIKENEIHRDRATTIIIKSNRKRKHGSLILSNDDLYEFYSFRISGRILSRII